jgi:hypothetical protein
MQKLFLRLDLLISKEKRRIMIYNVLEFGAIGDGVTNDAKAIQAAIDMCNINGGGQVLIPAGKTYYTGSFILKSNVDFHIERGAVIKASDDLKDYYPLANDGKVVSHSSGLPSFLNSEYAGKPFNAFIYGLDEENVSITGFGTIDANEKIFYGHDSGYHIEGTYYPRIPLLLLENFKHLTIKEVTMINCAFWTVHIVGCEDVLIDGIRILNNLKMANSDGIDPDHCKNVRITNCHIECGDDCIVLKNTGDYNKYGDSENILITNCTLVSTSAAIKIGTEGERNFKNIMVNQCAISRSNRGISIQIRDSGNVENVIFSNINIETRRFSHEWWGRAEAICLTAIDRKAGTKAGKIKNVKFVNINCNGENGIFIYGSSDNYIEDVYFENVNVELDKVSKWDVDGYDIRPCPVEGDVTGNIKRKIAGVYCNYAKDICMKNVKIVVHEKIKPYFDKEVDVLEVENFKIN